jgi:membrane protein implicated in regulation of membrane protease activity
MILDRILTMVTAALGLAAMIAAVTVPFTGLPFVLAISAIAAALLLWLVHKTITATQKANHS